MSKLKRHSSGIWLSYFSARGVLNGINFPETMKKYSKNSKLVRYQYLAIKHSIIYAENML